MASLSVETVVGAQPGEVFAYMDEFPMRFRERLTGMGIHLRMSVLSPNATGEGAIYRWRGRILGWPE